MMGSRRKFISLCKNLGQLLIIITLPLLHSATGSNALLCYCNVCPGTDTCETIPDSESTCFKSVEKAFINGTYSLEATYGCLSGGEGLLSHLQCHANLRHTEPRAIKCCKHEDYCNGELPDPSEADDPRWKIDPPLEPEPKKYPTMNSIELVSIVAGVGIVFIVLLIAKKTYSMIISINSCNGSARSTCSSKADLEKFHQHVAVSSSVSTHSYSISDDLCHKPIEPNNDEGSFMPQDLTSGLGERMLNPRTMARAIGLGKTDHVGNGRFGRVFRGQYHGEDVAVKAFRTIDQDSWKREDTIFRYLNHENIVRFIASEVTSVEGNTTEIWMFLGYCPYGSLCDFLNQNEIMGPQQAVKILYSIIDGLNYLHEDYQTASKVYKPSIAHRDIKSKNILMKTPSSCCIADFGHALVKLGEERLDYGKYQHLQVGTIRYMAPEILRPIEGLNYRDFKTFAQADLYQYGLILWEVCQRTSLDILHQSDKHLLPYDGVVPQNPDIQDMIKIVCDDQYRPPKYEKWEKYPIMKRLADLMVECWRANPKGRMETLGMKFRIKEIHDQCVPPPTHHPLYNVYHNYSLSPNFRNDRDKTKSSDVTL